MTLAAGTRLGPYEITAKLGEGGMGEVFRATDTKLRREVAIKVLPEAFVADGERLARFEREAQLLAQLHHPHIASIFGLEESGGVRALVLELVEGPTLAERVAAGALPVEEALPIAKQIAEALEAAHAKGIVHRDLKPQNVKLAGDGAVKVLDFGLAKAMDPTAEGSGAAMASPTLLNSPTLTAAGTQLGVILGTAAYMAPEQAKGFATDKRVDIWAFGVVLYEMLTGARLFAGDSVADTLAGVLRAGIDLDKLPEGTPPAIRRLLRRCLERNPKNRLHDIADARLVIEDVERGEADAPAVAAAIPAAAPARLGWRLPAALVAVAAAAALAGWLAKPAAGPAAPDLEAALALPPGYVFALTNYTEIAFSADGRRQVVTVFDEKGQSHLLVRDLDAAEPRLLAGSEGAFGPALSPDGQSLAFVQNGGLHRMALAGGPAVRLADVSGDYRGETWSADGYIYLAIGTATPLVRVAEGGGPLEPVTTLDVARQERTHRWPEALPDGSAVLFTCDTTETSEFYDDARIEAVRPATGERKVVLEGSSQARFLPPDHLLFARGGTLFAVRFDPTTLATTGTPVPLLQGVSTEVSSGAVRFATSAAGSAIWVPGVPTSSVRRLEWIAPDGTTTPAGLPDERFTQVRLSPDGRRLAATIDSTTSADLWAIDLAGGGRLRLTFSGSPTDFLWTPDGRRIVYAAASDETGLDMYWKPADGSGEAERLLALPGDDYPTEITSDGRTLLFEKQVPGRNDSNLWRLDLATREATPLLDNPWIESFSALSPDGRYLAYASSESASRPQVLVVRYPELTGKWQVSTRGGNEPHWSPEGDAIYYRSDGTLYRVAIDTHGGFVATSAPQPIAEGMMARGTIANSFTVGRDGRVLLARNLQQEARPTQVFFALDLAGRARRATAPKR